MSALKEQTMTYTIDEALDAVGFGPFQWMLWLLSGVGFGASTVQMLLPSIAIPLVRAAFGVDDKQAGLLITLLFVGEIIGGIVWAWIADRAGRRVAFVGTATATAFFGLLSAFAPSFPLLLLARFLVGIGLGGALSIDLVYFLEFVPARNRSRRTTVIIFVGILGMLYMAGVGAALRPDWKRFFAACAAPAVLLAVGRLMWPWETPRFLVTRGRFLEAERVLEAMARWNRRPLPLGHLVATTPIFASTLRINTFIEAFAPKLRLQTLLAGGIMFAHSFAYHGLFNWIDWFASSVGIKNVDVCFTITVNALAQIPGLLLAALCIGRVGGRWIMTTSLLGVAIAASFLLFVRSHIQYYICSAALHFFIVNIWASIYILVPELFPTTFRSSAFAVCGLFAKTGVAVSATLFSAFKDAKVSGVVAIGIVVATYAIASVASLGMAFGTVGNHRLADHLQEVDK